MRPVISQCAPVYAIGSRRQVPPQIISSAPLSRHRRGRAARCTAHYGQERWCSGPHSGGNMTQVTVKSRMKSGARALVLGTALAGAVAVWPAYACGEEPAAGSKQSDIGAVTGLAVGAAAGGPIGAMIGVAAGALLGDRYHRQAQSRAVLAQDLKDSEAERGRLTQDLTRLDTTLQEEHAKNVRLDTTLGSTDQLEFDVSYRTDDDALSAQALSPLLKLGALVQAMPQARVRVAGYADPRGSDAHNDELSLRRARGVAAALMSAGVSAERIRIEAHGRTESTSASGDLDAYALERRVIVRVELPAPAGQVARRE
jgi:outer membrane protein OmpA-like peptidoglycan-associated protein